MDDILLRIKYSFMVTYASIMLLSPLIFNVSVIDYNHYLMIMYWLIFILTVNIKIVYNKFNGLLMVIPPSYALPATLSYFGLIDEGLSLGLSYLVLLSYVFILYWQGRLNNMIFSTPSNKILLIILTFLSMIVFGILYAIDGFKNLAAIGVSNVLFFAIAGPVIEGIVLLTALELERTLLSNSYIYESAVIANILFLPLIVSFNSFLMFLSLAFNSVKILSGLKIGVLVDYIIRLLILAMMLVGVGAYA